MFSFAILIGTYSYFILALGLSGLLYRANIIILTLVYIITMVYFSKKLLKKKFVQYYQVLDKLPKLRPYLLVVIFISIIVLQAMVNLLGTLGPESAFDALWYHLALPKLYLDNHSIFFIPGGLIYYSAMPKLTEMLYVSALAINGEILAKLIHFSFGILSLIALFKLSRNFFSPRISLIAVVVFYSNLVIGWQSTTAYVDLTRTFFEIMAFWGFVNFWKKGERKWLIESAVMLGLAVSTKLLALGSLVIFTILFVYVLFLKSPPRRSHGFSFSFVQDQPATIRGVSIIGLFVYWVICLLIPLPWFVFSYINTGNPVYPFFTDIYKVGFSIELLNPFRFVREVWAMFIGASDPISPIYIIFLPLVILFFFRHLRDSGQARLAAASAKRARMTIFKVIAIYCLLAIVVWYITPRTGGGRFILPYLPAFSILVVAIIEMLKDKWVKKFIITIIIFISLVSIVYRGIANTKYVPVLLGQQTKTEFLTNNLNFSFGDFYDTDDYFKKHMKPKDTVLLYGFHNLYYVDFPFIDSSWVKKGDSFNYVAIQNTDLPKRFSDWDIVYQNPKTHIKLYSRGGIKWAY